jgi:hypothetical protein
VGSLGIFSQGTLSPGAQNLSLVIGNASGALFPYYVDYEQLHQEPLAVLEL